MPNWIAINAHCRAKPSSTTRRGHALCAKACSLISINWYALLAALYVGTSCRAASCRKRGNSFNHPLYEAYVVYRFIYEEYFVTLINFFQTRETTVERRLCNNNLHKMLCARYIGSNAIYVKHALWRWKFFSNIFFSIKYVLFIFEYFLNHVFGEFYLF